MKITTSNKYADLSNLFGNIEAIKFIKESIKNEENRELDDPKNSVGRLLAETDHECNCEYCEGGDYDIIAKFNCYICSKENQYFYKNVGNYKDEEEALEQCDNNIIKCQKCNTKHIYNFDLNSIFPVSYDKIIIDPSQLTLKLDEG